MLTFNLLTNGLYLAADADSARVAFVSLLPSPDYDTFELSNDWWNSFDYNGYFVFFPPAVRNLDAWNAFATNVRAVFALPGAQNAQFGWFPTDTAVAADVPLVFVSRSSGVSPSVQGTNQLRFRNIAFFIKGLPSFQSASIQYDDTANNFVFANQSLGSATSIALTVAVPPTTSPSTYPAQSTAMLLPMQGALVGCVQADFALAETDLALFEAGIMYFAGPAKPGDPLTALRYPVFRAPAALPFSVSLDWLTPVFAPGPDGEGSPRSFFLFPGGAVGSYFVQNPGTGAFDLTTVDVATAQSLGTFPGCLVLANRPFNQTTDSLYYYLAPAGLFDLSNAAGGAGPGTAALVCGISGTELFAVGLGDAAPDSFNFVAGQAAYQLPPVTGQPTSRWLSDEGGDVTTAWVEWITRPIVGTNAGAYIAQPDRSPLYRQTDGGTDTNSGLSVYLLSFNQLPVWSPSTSTIAQVNGSSSTPAVPLAPYAGIAVSTTDALAPFTQMDSAALAPTRAHAFAGAVTSQVSEARATAEALEFSMTPQGLLAGFQPGTNDWSTLQIAISGDDNILQLTELGAATQQAFLRNQIFLVASRDQDSTGGSLFGFTGPSASVTISDWVFNLALAHAPPDPATNVPQPILIFKLYPGRSIADLVDDVQQWTSPSTFNADPVHIQSTIEGIIDTALAEVADDPSSIFANFCTVVNDPAWTGVLALNGGIDVQDLPPAIRALLGGMVDNRGTSLIDTNFFAHHVGVPINDTQDSATPALSQSSLFAVVDYEGPTPPGSPAEVVYFYQVQYLRVLFLNSSLNEFDSKVNLTINSLFDVAVDLNPGGTQTTADGNLLVITGSYQAQSTNDPTALGVYSFIADGTFAFTFADNAYLKSIELTKVQFSAEGDAPVGQGSDASQITAQFAIWGSMVFNELDVLDIFSFDKLTFAGLGIGVSFDLDQAASPPVTNLGLDFEPGDLRLDLANSPPREGGTSLLGRLPFKLSSFLYSQDHDQTLESLDYIALTSVPGLGPIADTFNYAFLFDLDLGSLGGLVGSLSAFKFSAIIGWLNGGGVALGFQLPSANGKLEISIEGILTLSIGEFQLQYQAVEGSDPPVNVLSVVLFQSYMEILGTRLPPTGFIDFALFAPQSSPDQIGWIVAYDNEAGKDAPARALAAHAESGDPDDGDSSAFELLYLGLGQRVGPSADDTPTTFQGFLDFMTKDFQDAVTSHDYANVYQPTGGWLAVGHMKILGMVDFGLVFYDTTPFYSLTLNVVDLFDFEITYTKVSDSVGMFFANLALPDSLRTFQVGVASLTLPSLGITVYTNGNWKIDLGFPANDDWSRAFQVQAQAGPVPITGAGGFYLASLSSATDPDIFQNTYSSIIAFGFGARLGVGKDFTAGPLKAGISVTFFGIIEGAAGYLTSSSMELFQKPNALSLKGQFGVIGQIYGSVDFKIIKAAVNVTLQASIGIVLVMEDGTGNDGSILLYVEASVSVSARVSINLGLFSISISFSFNMSVRFDWQLTGSSGAQAIARVEAARAILASRAALAMPAAGLYPGLNASLPLMYLPEITVVFPDATGVGDPWFVCSLAIPYADSPPANPAYADFQPFEALVTQLTTWALVNVLGLGAYDSTVTQDEIAALDSDPTTLVGQVDYPALLAQLAVFQASVVAADPSKPSPYPNATPFAMPPFLTLSTTGRAGELDYTFASNNLVSQDYIDTTLQDYFNQLYINQTSQASAAAVADTTTVPLAQAVFLDYCTGLIRGAVHALLQTMQDGDMDSSPLDKLFQAAVGTGQIKTLAGQTASYFRGGARLPYTPGMTLPTGPAATGTNSLYGLLWQEFPVGATTAYTIALSNADTTQPWLACAASFALTSAMVAPYQNLTAQVLDQPGQPTGMPYLNPGGQSFAFQNAVAWNNGTTTASLRAFPTSLASLQQAQGTTPINAIVASRETGAAYLPGGTALATSEFTWATQITLSVKPTPGGAPNSPPLKNTFNVTGASQADQLLLEQIIQSAIPEIASVLVLYQNAQSGSSAVGLNSAPITPDNVFVLRTNTTTVSVPPSAAMARATLTAPTPDPVPVGATIAEVQGFLQILEQAVVTNAPGYYLYYEDSAGNTLPSALFTAGAAPVTILISYNPSAANDCQTSAQIQPWYNAIVLAGADPALLYYAVTTDAALDTQYPAVATGSVSIQLTRDNDSARLTVPRSLSARRKAPALDFQRKHTPAQLHRALLDAGVADPHEMDRLLVEAGASNTQLNALYSVLTYQAGPLPSGAGYITSNLSSPIQPQTPPLVPSCPVGTPPPPDSTSNNTYVVSLPIANIATGNQPLQSGIAPDPYASLNLPYAVSFFLTDVFGNQVPVQSTFSANNLYFDGLIAVDQWQGVPTTYDFGASPAPGELVVYLTPSAAAFPADMSATQLAAVATLYQNILDQITAVNAVTQKPTVSFQVETNLAVNADGTMVQIALDTAQTSAIVDLVSDMIAYLNGRAASQSTPLPAPVALSVSVAGAGVLPPLFEIAVTIGIQRDPSMVVPEVLDSYPPAQSVSSTVAPASASSSNLTQFASAFQTAFPTMVMAVSMNGAQAPQDQSLAGQARKRLRAAGLPGDGTGSGSPGPQSLWAIQNTLTNIAIGGDAASPLYISPTPLSTNLESGTVPLPVLPPVLGITLPSSQLFTDVDLDLFNEQFFQSVDTVLAPASATAGFQAAPGAYTTIAQGRELIAEGYSTNEVDWLFPSGSPFQGVGAQLAIAQEALQQQMRAALMSAYSIDTIVEYPVTWNGAVPPAVGDQVSLFGQVAPAANSPAQASDGYTFSTSAVAVDPSGTGLFTFLFGALNVADAQSIVTRTLQYTITHIEYFLQPGSDTPEGEARPSMWLQLVAPIVKSVSSTGQTQIPVVFRQYPTLPSLMSQTWTAQPSAPQDGGPNPLVSAAGWYLDFQYQAQLTPHDQILAAVTYNTDLAPSTSGGTVAAADDAEAQAFSLWEALARWSAVYAAIQPTLSSLPPDPGNASDPATVKWQAALSAFADCVTEVVSNTDWNPELTSFVAEGLQHVTDNYTITDVAVAQTSAQLISLVWPAAQGPSHFPGVTLGVLGVAPDGTPYPDQTPGTTTNGITDQYTPRPPIVNDWVQHQVQVNALNVLVQENAQAGLQIERNDITLGGYTVQPEFIYTTPLVSFSQPVTPFVENTTPIDITTLPNQGTAPNPPCVDDAPNSLCQRIYTMLYDLLFSQDAASALIGAYQSAGVDSTDRYRRVKLQANFQYPIASGAGGAPGAPSVIVSTPVVLARSFNIDVTTTDQLDDLVAALTGNISDWSQANGIVFGSAPIPSGGQLVFDITLYAELSGSNTPVLRLGYLYVSSSDIALIPPAQTAAAH
jgi:hypothetical protein